MIHSPRPSLTITNLSVQATSHTSSWILTSRQSWPQGLPPPVAQARLARVVVAEVSAAVMASKSGARAAAASFCWAVVGLSWTAVVVASMVGLYG